MINIKPQIYKALTNIADNVNDTYPADFTTFPVVQYVEEENKTHCKTDDKEQEAYVRYKIDIWNNKSTSDIAVAIDEVFSNFGFKRTQCLDVPDTSKLKHKVMRFEAIIDINNMRVYNK